MADNIKRCPLTKTKCWGMECELWVEQPEHPTLFLGWDSSQWLLATGKTLPEIQALAHVSRENGFVRRSCEQALELKSNFLKNHPEPPREFTGHCGLRRAAGK